MWAGALSASEVAAVWNLQGNDMLLQVTPAPRPPHGTRAPISRAHPACTSRRPCCSPRLAAQGPGGSSPVFLYTFDGPAVDSDGYTYVDNLGTASGTGHQMVLGRFPKPTAGWEVFGEKVLRPQHPLLLLFRSSLICLPLFLPRR